MATERETEPERPIDRMKEEIKSNLNKLFEAIDYLNVRVEPVSHAKLMSDSASVSPDSRAAEIPHSRHYEELVCVNNRLVDATEEIQTVTAHLEI